MLGKKTRGRARCSERAAGVGDNGRGWANDGETGQSFWCASRDTEIRVYEGEIEQPELGR